MSQCSYIPLLYSVDPIEGTFDPTNACTSQKAGNQQILRVGSATHGFIIRLEATLAQNFGRQAQQPLQNLVAGRSEPGFHPGRWRPQEKLHDVSRYVRTKSLRNGKK